MRSSKWPRLVFGCMALIYALYWFVPSVLPTSPVLIDTPLPKHTSSPPKPSLYLFVGPRKTGSSTIQKDFESFLPRTSLLEQYNLYISPYANKPKYYADLRYCLKPVPTSPAACNVTRFYEILRYLTTPCPHSILNANSKFASESNGNAFRSCHAESCNKVILSEGLSAFEKFDFLTLQALLPLTDVHAVVYVRQLFATLFSLYHEREKRSFAPRLFSRNPPIQNPYTTGTIFEEIRSSFPKERRHFLCFDGILAANRSLTKEGLYVMGIDVQSREFFEKSENNGADSSLVEWARRPPSRVNPSPPQSSFDGLYILNWFAKEHGLKHKQLTPRDLMEGLPIADLDVLECKTARVWMNRLDPKKVMRIQYNTGLQLVKDEILYYDTGDMSKTYCFVTGDSIARAKREKTFKEKVWQMGVGCGFFSESASQRVDNP